MGVNGEKDSEEQAHEVKRAKRFFNWCQMVHELGEFSVEKKDDKRQEADRFDIGE